MAGRKGKSLVVRRSFPFRPAFLLLSGREKSGCGGESGVFRFSDIAWYRQIFQKVQ